MSYGRLTGHLAALVTVAALLWASSAAGQGVTFADGATGQWIIVLSDPRSAHRKRSVAGFGYSRRASYDADPVLNRIAQRVLRDHGLESVEQWPIESLNVHCLIVDIPSGDGGDSTVRALQNDKRVESLQPLNEFELLGDATADPYRDMQPALDLLNLASAHRYVTGRGVTVAIVDTAVDTAHPELVTAVKVQEDMVQDPLRPLRAERHGTGIAGIIAAATNNGVGISGVAPNIGLLSFRGCWQSSGTPATSRCNSLTLSKALDRAIRRKPDILNLSLTGPPDPLLEQLVGRLVDQGVIVVTAYDENRSPKQRFPVARDGVIFARGTKTAIAPGGMWWAPAPAVDVLTAQPGSRYDFLSGNSLAAAHITGTIALLLEARPDMQPRAIHATLRDNVEQHEDVATVNLCSALRQIDTTIACGI